MRSGAMLIALALTTTCFALDPPTPTPTKSTAQPQRSDGQQQQQARADQSATIPQPTFVEIVKTPVIQTEPTEKTQNHRDYTSSEWWTVYATWFLVAFTLGLAIYTAKLWRSTKNLVEKNEASSQAALRAYVFVASPTSENFHARDGVKIKIPIENCGGTPASNVRVFLATLYWPLNEAKFPSVILNANARQCGVMPPKARVSMGITVSPSTPENMQGFSDGTIGLYVIGAVDYTDAFSIPRHTSFRYVLGGVITPTDDNKMTAAQDGNDYT